jgi:predicted nucleotidyltransferase
MEDRMEREDEGIDGRTGQERSMIEFAVQRIAHALDPIRIVLFGSAARNLDSEPRDLDFLVVMPDGTHRRRAARAALRALMDLGMPKDVVVVTESDVKTYGENASMVIAPALAHGKEIYRAAS